MCSLQCARMGVPSPKIRKPRPNRPTNADATATVRQTRFVDSATDFLASPSSRRAFGVCRLILHTRHFSDTINSFDFRGPSKN